MDLEDKVKLAIKGDDKSFYELIQLRKETLYRVAYTYVKNQEDSLDILSETVYKAYVSIKKLKEPKYFNTWLTRIMVNTAIDFIRKNKKVVYLDDNPLSEAVYNEDFNEDRMDLFDAVDKLNEKHKSIIILKYFEDMTLKEIADVMECPLGTVKTNLHRALEQLRSNLKKEEDLEYGQV